MSVARAKEFANAWGADFWNAGALGHMGNDDHLDMRWEGVLLLARLLETAAL